MGKFRRFESSQSVSQHHIHSYSAGYTLRRWRSTILGEVGNEVASLHQPLELTPTISSIWEIIPQELIDYIVSLLEDDLRSLQACSLTCKVMFVSARRRKIYLTWDNNWELLTVPERKRYLRGERRKLAVRVLSTFAVHGLLPYARHPIIHINKNFTPANLQPFNVQPPLPMLRPGPRIEHILARHLLCQLRSDPTLAPPRYAYRRYSRYPGFHLSIPAPR